MRAIILGAGVMGLTCAWELVQRGCQVQIKEQYSAAGRGCSYYAGAMLAPWCEQEYMTSVPNKRLMEAWGQEALIYWSEILGPQCWRTGTLVVAAPQDLPELKQFAGKSHHFQWVRGEEIRALEPSLNPRLEQGLFFPEEGHLDPRAALPFLAKKLQQSQKAEILYNTSTSLEAELAAPFFEKEATILIDCRGYSACDHLKSLRGVRGEMVLVSAPAITLQRTIRLLHPRHSIYVVPRHDGLYMVGATMIESDFQEGASPENPYPEAQALSVKSVLELLHPLYGLDPGFGEATLISFGAGTRACFPDHLPKIYRAGRVIYVNGLYRHGFLFAPRLARYVADVILNQTYTESSGDQSIFSLLAPS